MSAISKHVSGNTFMPHQSPSWDYVHYYAINAKWNIANALANQNPIDAINEAKEKINAFKNRQRENISELNLDLKDAKDIEYLLMSSDWLQNFEPVTSLSGGLTMPDFGTDIDIAENAISDAIDTWSTNSDSLIKVAKKLQDMLELTPQDIQDYSSLLNEYFLHSYRNKYDGGMSGRIEANAQPESQWQARALEALLGRSNEYFFKGNNQKYKAEKFRKWSADKSKLLTAMILLEDPQFPKYVSALAHSDITIRHGNGNTEPTPNTKQILEAFFTKLKDYFNQMDAIGLEAASGKGIINAQKNMGEAVDKMHDNISNFSGKGNVTVTYDFSDTKQFFDRVNKTAYKNAHTRARKSDAAAIDIGENGVTVFSGITVKKIRDLFFNPERNTSVNIILQRGTPLLTLLAREAGFNKNELFSTVQLLAAHGSDNDYEAGLVQQWNNVMQTAKYRAFLQTLAGFTNDADTSLYMVINRSIYNIGDILSAVANVNETYVDWTVNSKTEGSLEYEDYNSLNNWIGTDNDTPNYSYAEVRSEIAFQSIVGLLYSTKIRITLNALDLSRMAAING